MKTKICTLTLLEIWKKCGTWKHDNDGDTNCKWCTRDNLQRIGKGTGRLGNKMTSRDHLNYGIVKNTERISCLNFWDEACWFLSLRVFGLLSSSLLLFPQRFGRYVLRPSSGVCRTREPSRNFELRPLLNPQGSPVLIPLAIKNREDCWRLEKACCHLNSSEKPSANAAVKNTQKIRIIIIIIIIIITFPLADIDLDGHVTRKTLRKERDDINYITSE